MLSGWLFWKEWNSARTAGLRRKSEPVAGHLPMNNVHSHDVFGREEDIAFLDRAWANKDVNVVTFTVFRESTAPGSGSFRTAAIARIVFGPINRIKFLNPGLPMPRPGKHYLPLDQRPRSL